MVRAIQKDGLNVGANSLIDQYYFIISALNSKIDLTLNENEIHVNIHMVLLDTDWNLSFIECLIGNEIV